MRKVRGHDPVVIEEMNGLWARGDDETCPKDHLIRADNIQFYHSGIETRTAIKPYVQQNYAHDLRQTKRVYNYVTQTGQTLLVLVSDGNVGTIYHIISPDETYEILKVTGMEDFAFLSIAGKAYISPFKIYTTVTSIVGEAPEKYALGLKDNFLYVYYRPPGTPAGTTVRARTAAGDAPKTLDEGGFQHWNRPFQAYESTVGGIVTPGSHAFAVSYPTSVNMGPAVVAAVISTGEKSVELINIPIGGVGTTSRIIWMTKANTYKPKDPTIALFKAATINDNTTTTLRLNVADASLTETFVAGGSDPRPFSNGLLVENAPPVPPALGFSDIGFHLVGVVYETDSGYLSAPGPQYFGGNTYVNESMGVQIDNIPVGPAESINPAVPSRVVKRHIVSTKMIPEYNGDQKGYQFFFVPKGTLENNTATSIYVNYYDSDLVADASHLIENFSKIPAGVDLCEYHGRMVLVGDSNFPKKLDGTPDTTKPDNRSVAWVSAAGEPEAINQVDGLIITPLDGKPLTHCQDFRDVLYLFKQNRTYSVVDNEDEPTTWGPVETVDQGIGCSVHGMAEVLDSGGTNVDYLIIVDWSGLMLFNGTYARPELSWKIENIWDGFNKNEFHNIQIANDSINKKIWLTSPDSPNNPNTISKLVWLADYGNGMNPKDIRWARWNFETYVVSLVLYRANKVIMGTYLPTSALAGYGF